VSRPIRTLAVTEEQRQALGRLVNRPTASRREHCRAWIILNRATGLSQTDTAGRVGVRRQIVSQWESRFRQKGLAGLAEAPGRGRKNPPCVGRLSPRSW